MGKPLGELNGMWTMWFKLSPIVFGSMVTLMGWMLKNELEFREFMRQGERFTQKDAVVLELKITKDIGEVRKDLAESIKVNRDERNAQMSQVQDKLTLKLEALQISMNQLTLMFEKHIAKSQ